MFKKFKKIFGGIGKSKKSKDNKKVNTNTTPEQPVNTTETTVVATTTTPNNETITTTTITTPTTTSVDIRANLEAIIKGIQENRILEVFDKYYHDDITMFENGNSENRVGKAANRKAEEGFVNNATIHEARLLRIIVDGNNSAYEMFMDFTYGGNRIQKSQWSHMEWKDGLVIKEEFNENKAPALVVPPTTTTESSSSSSSSVDIRANMEAIIKGIQESRILEVFDKYYHDDIVMFENGNSENRVGKEANRKAEEGFVNNATIHEAKVLRTIVDGNNSAYEMYMDFTYGGNRVQKSQWSFMEWKDGKVIKEEFNENKGPAAAPVATEETPVVEETKLAEVVDIRANMEAIIKGIQEGRILEVFDKYYHDEVVMFENGNSENRVGKEANRKAEEGFVNNATIHEAKVLRTIVDGNNSAYEMFMDFTYGGNRIQKTQWSHMEWKDGKVIKEEFNENKGPAAATSPVATEETPVVATTESSSSELVDIRANMEAIIKGIQENRILEVFDKYYHDEVVMSEKGDSTNRVGKEANRKAEESFVNNATIHEAKVLRTIVDGNNSAYEMYMDFTYGGNKVQKSQWSFMEWKDGLVIKEEFN